MQVPNWLLLLVLCIATIAAFGGHSFADDRDDCARAERSADLAITACTRIITSTSADVRSLVEAYDNRGRALESKKQHDAAIADYNNAIDLNQNSGSAYYDRGLAFLARGQGPAASHDFQISKDLLGGPGGAEAQAGVHLRRGRDYGSKGQYDLAVSELQVALNLRPLMVEAQTELAYVYQDSGKYDLAVTAFTRAIDLTGPVDAYIGRGRVFQLLGQHDLAIADQTKAIALDARNAFAYFNRGVVYKSMGLYSPAAVDFGKALAIRVDYPDVYASRGNLYLESGQYQLALADLNQAIRLKPNLSSAYSDRGHVYLATGSQELAIADFDEAIHLGPADANALIGRASAYVYRGENEKALADLSAAEKLLPANDKLLTRVAALRFQLDRQSKAVASPGAGRAGDNSPCNAAQTRPEAAIEACTAVIDSAVASPADRAMAYRHRGDAYLALKKNDLALRDYQRVIELTPDSPVGYIGRARTYAVIGNQERALADADRAVDLDAKSSEAYLARAYIYRDRKEVQLAILDFDKAIRLKPDNSEAYYQLSLLREANGEPVSALGDVTAAIRLMAPDDPLRPTAEARLADLQGRFLIRQQSTNPALQAQNKTTSPGTTQQQAQPEPGPTASASASSRRAPLDILAPPPAIPVQQAQLDPISTTPPPSRRAPLDILVPPPAIPLAAGTPRLVVSPCSTPQADGNRRAPLEVLVPGAACPAALPAPSDQHSQPILTARGAPIEVLSPTPGNRPPSGTPTPQPNPLSSVQIADVATCARSADPQETIEACSRLIDSGALPTEVLAAAYLRRGAAKMLLGQNQGAYTDFDSTISLKSDLPTAYLGRGVINSSLGQHDRAIADYSKSIELDPGAAPAYGARGIEYTRTGKSDLALVDFNKSIQLNPNDPLHYLERGRVYDQIGDYVHSVSDLEKALSLAKPDDSIRRDAETQLALVRRKTAGNPATTGPSQQTTIQPQVTAPPTQPPGPGQLPAGCYPTAGQIPLSLKDMAPIDCPTYRVVQRGGVTNIEVKGPTVVTRDIGCMPINEVRRTDTARELFRAALACVFLRSYDRAADLVAIADAYWRFDALRVAERGAALNDMFYEFNTAIPDGARSDLAAAVKLSNGGPGLDRICAELTRIGAPDYFPAYLLAKDMTALLANRDPLAPGLLRDFDAAKAWPMVLREYQHCSGPAVASTSLAVAGNPPVVSLLYAQRLPTQLSSAASWSPDSRQALFVIPGKQISTIDRLSDVVLVTVGDHEVTERVIQTELRDPRFAWRADGKVVAALEPKGIGSQQARVHLFSLPDFAEVASRPLETLDAKVGVFPGSFGPNSVGFGADGSVWIATLPDVVVKPPYPDKITLALKLDGKDLHALDRQDINAPVPGERTDVSQGGGPAGNFGSAIEATPVGLRLTALVRSGTTGVGAVADTRRDYVYVINLDRHTGSSLIVPVDNEADTNRRPTSIRLATGAGSATVAGEAQARGDPEIAAAQARLKSLGLYQGMVDGLDGPGTQGAVLAFQTAHPELTADGVLGPKTMAALAQAAGSVGNVTALNGSAQRLLVSLGGASPPKPGDPSSFGDLAKDRQFDVFDTGTLKLVSGLGGGVVQSNNWTDDYFNMTSGVLTPNGRFLVFGTKGGNPFWTSLGVADLDTGKLIQRMPDVFPSDSFSLSLSPDGQRLLVTGKPRDDGAANLRVFAVALGSPITNPSPSRASAPDVRAGAAAAPTCTIVVASTTNAAAGDGGRRCLADKEAFKDCSDCPEMVVIPPGTFTMGAPSSDAKRSPEEVPDHPVAIPRAFAIGRFAVTRSEFAAFVRDSVYQQATSCNYANGSPIPGGNFLSPGFTQTDRHPVVCVSWNDAKAYAAWLTKKTGRSYRLLTEAEWEYAERAGTTTPFFFGDYGSDSCKAANGYDETYRAQYPTASPTLACRDGYVFTAPVGTFAPNAFGLYDMSGNALTWVEDCYHANYGGAPRDGSAWTGENCSTRTQRGASWRGSETALRSAHRVGAAPTDRVDWVGFRVASSM